MNMASTASAQPVNKEKEEEKKVEEERMEVREKEDEEEEEGELDEGTAIAAMTHQDAMERFKDGLAEIIIGDPLLNDLHTAVTLEEINSQIAVEYGQAMTIIVRRMDDQVLPVVVVQNATVQELKHAIQRAFILKQKREDGTLHISWRYVWRSYWLYFNGEKLMVDNKTLKSYGIRNKDEVTFIKRLKKK